MSSKEVEEEKKSDAGGKIKVPSFLHEETAKPKPAWMHKLAQARAIQASRNSLDPSITKKEVQDEDEKEEEEDTPAALPSRQAAPPQRPPPLSSLDISEHSVKGQVQHLDATTPKGSVRKVPAGAPDYLLTGTVPKGKQLDEQTRKADLYVKHQQQQQQQQQQAGGELSGSSSPSGILSAKLKTLQRLKDVRSSLTSGTDDSSKPVMTSAGNLPLAKKTILDSDSEEVFEDVDEEIEEEVVNDDTMDDDEDDEGWEEDSSASPLGEMSVEENDFIPPLAFSRGLPLPPSPPAPEPVKPAPPSPQSPEQTTGPASHPKAAAFTSTTVNKNKGADKTTMEKETSIRSEQPFDEQGDDSWMFPHHNEDDSSWVNPSHPIQQDRKEHLNDELKKKSVDLFPENGEKTQRLANLLSIDEEQKYSDRDLPVVLDTRLGLIVEHHKDGETISATSFSEMSGKVDSTHIMESSVPDRELDVWAMPSQDRTTYRAVGRLDSHKDGKDYRFSYIATQHTHSTSSYSDVVRERYFPKEDNEYWAAPAKEEQPELPLHINRSGKVQSGPSDEKESWMPPEDGSEDETKIDKKALYAPSIAEEKHSEARSVATYDSDWMARNKNTAIGKTARIDFTGAITEESSDGSFTWNPERAPTPPPGEPTVRAQTLFKELPGPPSETLSDDTELSKEKSNTRSFEATLAASPRPPSPAAQQPRDATPIREQHSKESAAPKEAKINDKYDYSPSGRLKFDMTPEMILIEDDVERGRAKFGSRRLQKNQRRRLCYLALCFLFLLVPAGVACIVIFVIDPNDKRDTDSNSNAVPAVPTAAPFTAPTTPTKPTNDGQSKPPSPTQTFFPVPSPGAPTATNTPIEPDVLVEFLTKLSSDGGASLQDTASAQYAAMQWIRSPANQGIFNDRVFVQRYALATLFYSTGGQQWASSSGWMTNTTECDWFTSSTVAQICDLDGNVVDLNLSSNNLAGPIPPEVNLLADNLASLQLHDNKLTGDLPRTVSDLSNLGLLNLANNLFRGTIPTLLGSLSNLNTLFLYSNAFRRTIPSQLGNLANLRVLDLGSNRLTGSIPTQLGNIRGLESLALYNNYLTDSIPASLSNIPSLRLLYLDNNSLEPSLPAAICNTLEFDEFWTDCEEIGGCDCCTKCCEDGQICT